MSDLITALPDTFSPALLALGAVLAFAESALGLGVVVPGELAVLVLGAAAGTPVQMLLALTVVTVAASAADHVGYILGRRYGQSLRGTRVVRRVGTEHWDRATVLLRRRGPAALVVSRLLPLVRTLVPAAAGAARMRYSRFLTGSLLGTTLWAALWIGAGALAGQALPRVAATLGRAGWLVLAGIVLAAGMVALRRRRARRAPLSEPLAAAAGAAADQPAELREPAPAP